MNRAYTYNMAAGMYGVNNNGAYVRLNEINQQVLGLPYGSAYTFTIVNNVITAIRYVGEPIIRPETWGIVTENNPRMGYLTVLDAGGNSLTRNYNPGNLRVQKTEHYDMRDTISHIHSMFPDMHYNPRETDISAIEPGDIVSFRVDPENPQFIVSISASTNYTTRYGRILDIRHHGATSTFLMEFENGATAWYTLTDGAMVRKTARPINRVGIQAGDWARILVNQAVIGPGIVMESVKGMEIEGDAHYISTIVKGRLTGINTVQNLMHISDAYTLERAGWANYRTIQQFNLNNPLARYYHNGTPVTLAFVNNFLRNAGMETYIALENFHGGERVRMVTFRGGRDELLNADTILSTDGNGGFRVAVKNPALGLFRGFPKRRRLGRGGGHLCGPRHGGRDDCPGSGAKRRPGPQLQGAEYVAVKRHELELHPHTAGVYHRP
jgi:hypothetical protein